VIIPGEVLMWWYISTGTAFACRLTPGAAVRGSVAV